MKSLNFPGLPRVLVIDDEEGIREGLRTLLQAEGVAVETATSAEDGVRRLGQKAFDIVFLDLNLPGTDGLSILPSLLRGTPPPDVVILTGFGVHAVQGFLFAPAVTMPQVREWLEQEHRFNIAAAPA